MIGEHQAPTPAEGDDGRVTDNAQRVAAHIAQALRHAGYSCAVLNLPPSPTMVTRAEPSVSPLSAASNDDD
jgi:hypothetical protein